MTFTCYTNPPNSASLSALTQMHNQGWRRAVKRLSQQYPSLQIVTLDANTLYRKAVTSPAFGFTNVVIACLSGHISGDPDQFLFWDGIHPQLQITAS